MYNSTNLPLEPRKVIKKSISSIVGGLIFSIVASLMIFVVSNSVSKSVGDDIPSFFYAVVAFIVINILLGGSSLVYQYLYYKFYYYNFEEDKAEIKKGVVAVATGHVRYARIQNIYVDQDILDRIMGLYDVHYETAGERSGFYSHVDGLSKTNAEKLIEFLNEKVMKKDSQNLSSGQNIEHTVSSEELEINDQSVYTRENVPIDKKVILAGTISGSISFVFFGIILFFELATGENDINISFFSIIPILIAVFITPFVGFYIYMKIWYKNFFFKFDAKSGVITSKVISVSNTYLYYDRIQNIDVSQSVIERVLGINKLVIETAGEGSKANSINIPGLRKENAELLKNFLIEKSQKYRSI